MQTETQRREENNKKPYILIKCWDEGWEELYINGELKESSSSISKDQLLDHLSKVLDFDIEDHFISGTEDQENEEVYGRYLNFKKLEE